MTQVLGFPFDLAIAIVMVAVAYFLAVHSPLLIALFMVWRRRRTMHRRILFVGTVMGATYGFLVLLVMAACVPIFAFVIFIAPALKEQGYLKDSLFLGLADFVSLWWWWLLPLVILIPAIFIARYFAARWNGIVGALNG